MKSLQFAWKLSMIFFGPILDYREEAWVKIALNNQEAAKQLNDRTVITGNPFDAKYSKVQATNWGSHALVIDPIAIKEWFREG